MGKEKQERRRGGEEEDKVGEVRKVVERSRRRRGGQRGGEDNSQGERGKWGERGSGWSFHPAAPRAQCGEAHFVSAVLLCTHTSHSHTHSAAALTPQCCSVKSENWVSKGKMRGEKGEKAQGSF